MVLTLTTPHLHIAPFSSQYNISLDRSSAVAHQQVAADVPANPDCESGSNLGPYSSLGPHAYCVGLASSTLVGGMASLLTMV